jgi:hypothetical protein
MKAHALNAARVARGASWHLKAYLPHADSASGRNGRIARAMGDGGFALQGLQVSVLKNGRIAGAIGDGGCGSDGSPAGRRLPCICGRKLVEPYARRRCSEYVKP